MTMEIDVRLDTYSIKTMLPLHDARFSCFRENVNFVCVLGHPLDPLFWALTISRSQLFACVWSGPGLKHMGPASLGLRLTAGQVAPYGWSVGAAFKPLLEVDMPCGHKAPCYARLRLLHLSFTLSRCRERERRKRKFEFCSKKLAKNYLLEDGKSIAYGLGRRVCFAILAGTAADGCSCARHS